MTEAAHHSHSDALSALLAMKSRHLVSRRCHTTSLTILGESTLYEFHLPLYTEPTSFIFSRFHDPSRRSNTRHAGCVHCCVLQRHILHSSRMCEDLPSVSGLRTSLLNIPPKGTTPEIAHSGSQLTSSCLRRSLLPRHASDTPHVSGTIPLLFRHAMHNMSFDNSVS